MHRSAAPVNMRCSSIIFAGLSFGTQSTLTRLKPTNPSATSAALSIASRCMQENYLDGLSPGCQAFFRTYAETFGDRTPHNRYPRDTCRLQHPSTQACFVQMRSTF